MFKRRKRIEYIEAEIICNGRGHDRWYKVAVGNEITVQMHEGGSISAVTIRVKE